MADNSLLSSSVVVRAGHVLRTVALSPVILARACLTPLEFVVGAPAPPSADLRGRRILVTGANTGIGRRAASRLAAMGATVILACRDVDKADRARAEILAEHAKKKKQKNSPVIVSHLALETLHLDLASFASVAAAARAVARTHGRLDVLVLNAGINANSPTLTHPDAPRVSLIFGVNFLGHYLFAKRLAAEGALGGAKIVCLSSVMHHFADLTTFRALFEEEEEEEADVVEEEEDDSAAAAVSTTLFFLRSNKRRSPGYAESKLAMNLLARAVKRGELFRAGTPVGPSDAIAVNPGAVKSDIWRTVPKSLKPAFDALADLLFLHPDQGAATTLEAVLRLLDCCKEKEEDPAAAAVTTDNSPVGSSSSSSSDDRNDAYLAPYYQPGPWLPFGRSAFEFVGPFHGGANLAYCRLPGGNTKDDKNAAERDVATRLWRACDALVADFDSSTSPETISGGCREER